MSRPCEFFLALTSQGFGTLKNSATYPWTPTVLISKLPSAAASMGFSPNFHHMQVLINAAAPASCDRIAGRRLKKYHELHSASLPILILKMPEGHCSFEQTETPFFQLSTEYGPARMANSTVSLSLMPPWRVEPPRPPLPPFPR